MYIDHQTQAELTDAYAATRTSEPLFRQFRALPFSNQFTLTDSIHLFSCFEQSRHAAGDLIYRAGEASENTLFIIISGKVAIANPDDNLDLRLAAGDQFGLFSFLDQQRNHSATASCLAETTLLRINRPYFDMISVENGELGNLLLRFMFQLLMNTSLKLGNEYHTADNLTPHPGDNDA